MQLRTASDHHASAQALCNLNMHGKGHTRRVGTLLQLTRMGLLNSAAISTSVIDQSIPQNLKTYTCPSPLVNIRFKVQARHSHESSKTMANPAINFHRGFLRDLKWKIHDVFAGLRFSVALLMLLWRLAIKPIQTHIHHESARKSPSHI